MHTQTVSSMWAAARSTLACEAGARGVIVVDIALGMVGPNGWSEERPKNVLLLMSFFGSY